MNNLILITMILSGIVSLTTVAKAGDAEDFKRATLEHFAVPKPMNTRVSDN